MAPPPLPTPEALTLAANIFHADVDAWLPKSFGVTLTPEQKDAEWAAARATGALRGGDRLGLGHPDAADPEARRAAQVSRAGGDILRRSLKRRGEEPDQPTLAKGRDEDDAESESRTRAVGSKKRKTADVFGKGKGKAAVHPLLNLKNPIPGYDAPAEAKRAAAPKPAAAKADESVNDAAALAASLSASSSSGGMRVVSGAKAKSAPPSPKVGRVLLSPSSMKVSLPGTPGTPASPTSSKTSKATSVASAPVESGASEEPAGEGKSRAALRREKRKAAKARKAAAEAA